MEISNKTLAMFLVAAMIVSLGATVMTLNKLNGLNNSGVGHATDTGIALLNVTTFASIKFHINTIDFGNGSVNKTGGYNNCTMWINETTTITKTGCVGFAATNAGGGFIVVNDGVLNVNVTLNSTDNVSTFIGGNLSMALFQYQLSENETGSCSGTLSGTSWTNVSKSDPNICNNMSAVTSANSLRIGLKVLIPDNAPAGSRQATFTVTGTAMP